MDCKEIDSPALLTFLFRENQERELNRIFKCFYQHYYETFIHILYRFGNRHPFLKDDPEFYGSQAFADGLLSFQEKMRDTGFVEGAAKVKSFFFSFCIYKLLALISSRRRDNDKYNKMVLDTKNDFMAAIDEQDLMNENEALFHQALGLLDEKRRQYILLRKIDKCTNEAIAAKMGITPGAVNNEVFKSFLKLKEIIRSLQEKK
jgi:RNA polymerase sigma factor (sigma-70 family)